MFKNLPFPVPGPKSNFYTLSIFKQPNKIHVLNTSLGSIGTEGQQSNSTQLQVMDHQCVVPWYVTIKGSA